MQYDTNVSAEDIIQMQHSEVSGCIKTCKIYWNLFSKVEKCAQLLQVQTGYKRTD